MIVAQFAAMTRGVVFTDMRRQWRPGAVAGALSIGTYVLALAAFTNGPTAPLVALRETGMATALLIGVNGPRRTALQRPARFSAARR